MSSRDVRQASLTIGEFARRSGLSQKALRLYDLSGLLTPAEVNPSTGYRLYAEEQLERARRIGLLRRMEMPLATVAEVLASTDEEAVRLLERWWAEQESAMRDKRGTFDYLRAELTQTGQPVPAYPVRLREVPETKVATIRQHLDQPALVPAVQRAERQIWAHLRAAGAEFPEPESWWIYYGVVSPDSEAPVEVCIPFTGTVDPAGPITIRIEPAHAEAYCTLSKDDCYYPKILAGYDAVYGYVDAHGLSRIGPPREVYFAPIEVPGTDPFVHVAQPVEETHA
jgi:DNA-binding transcriptional MerR regulator